MRLNLKCQSSVSTLPTIPYSEAAIAARYVEGAADQGKRARSRRALETDKPSTTTDTVDGLTVTCRRRRVTGSLVRTSRECHTTSDWARLDEDVRKQAGEYADHGRGGT